MYASIAAGKGAPTSPPTPPDPNSYASRTSTHKKTQNSPESPSSSQNPPISTNWSVLRATELSPPPKRRWPKSNSLVQSCPTLPDSLEPAPLENSEMLKLPSSTTPIFRGPRPVSERPVAPQNSRYLQQEEFERLTKIFGEVIEVDDKDMTRNWMVRSSKPSIRFYRYEMLHDWKRFFEKEKIRNRCYLIGGATCHVIDSSYSYSDVDIEFELNEDDIKRNPTIFGKIQMEMAVMLFRKQDMSSGGMKEGERTISESELDYIENSFYGKKIIVCNDKTQEPLWSLFNLFRKNGLPTEIKFTAKKGRSFILMGDSLKIELESFLKNELSILSTSSSDFALAIKCVQERSIYTEDPQNIVGGGFLKACMMKADGWTDLQDIPAGGKTMSEMRVSMLENFLKFNFREPNNFTKMAAIDKFLVSHYEIPDRIGSRAKEQMLVKRRTFLLRVEKDLHETRIGEGYQQERGRASARLRDIISKNERLLQLNPVRIRI